MIYFHFKYSFVKYPQLEDTLKDHQVQLLAPWGHQEPAGSCVPQGTSGTALWDPLPLWAHSLPSDLQTL